MQYQLISFLFDKYDDDDDDDDDDSITSSVILDSYNIYSL